MKRACAVAVTGLGLVTPLGCDISRVWERMMRGESGARFLPDCDVTKTGAGYHCPVVESSFPEGGGRHIAFALAAAENAIRDAGLDTERFRSRIGVSVGSSKGGLDSLIALCAAFQRGGIGAVDAAWSEEFFASSAATAIARRWGVRGPVIAPSAACATGAHAILFGSRMILSGEADIVVAGASDSCMMQLMLAGYRSMGVLAASGDRPSEACKPFDTRRDGFVLGEGSGIVILEERSHAEGRGAPVRARFLGGAVGEDIFHITAPDPSGNAPAEVFREALRNAGVEPESIQYVNAHGTGTRLNDPAETRTMKEVFKKTAGGISFSSTKPMTGHLLGAAGSVEFIISIMALENGVIPPTLNLSSPDPGCDLDFTPLVARRREIRNCASISCGFGGHIGVLVAGRA